jgi:membrane-associated phospholipid phosphatase
MKPAQREAWGQPGWLPQAAARLKSYWLLKMVGTTVAITAFMVVYFTLLQHPQFAVTAVPWTPLDRWIEFHAWGIGPYVSLWVYVSLVPALLVLRQEAPAYLSAVLLLSLIGFTIFLFWPTTVIQPDINWRLYPSVGFLKDAAPSGNACPSMHVAFSVLSALWLHRLLQRMGSPAFVRWINAGWCLLILWSTLALKQHLVLDVASGTALGMGVALPHLYLWPPSGMTESIAESLPPFKS